MLDKETRSLLHRKMIENLQAAAKISYVLDMDSSHFQDTAGAEYRNITVGTLVPNDKGIIIPARYRGRKGVNRMWCPICARWTDKIEIEPETGRQLHGGRKGCGGTLVMPDEVGRVRVDDVPGVENESQHPHP